MSERINVDHAFDPEARKAQADLDTYMGRRVFYKDDNGKIHDSSDGQKFATKEDASAYEDAQRNKHYEESLEQSDYSNESLDQLAQRVATARAEGDKTRANDAEEAFFNKFAEYSEKYGWENEDGSADGPHVDKDTKLGRSTIDDRLDRYSKIMYGEESTAPTAPTEESNTGVDEATPAAENAPKATEDTVGTSESQNEYVPKRRGEYKEETDTPLYDELMAKHRAEAASEPADHSVEEESTGFDVDAEIESAKAKIAEDAARKEAEAVAAINGTDQAKADRELLDGSKEKSSEDDDTDTGASKLKMLGKAPVEASDLKMLGGTAAKDDAEPRASRWRRFGTTSGLASEATTALAIERERGYNTRRNRIIAVLAGAAVAATSAYFLAKGHDILGGKGGSLNPNDIDPTIKKTPVDPANLPSDQGIGTARHIEGVRVNPGDGEIKVTQQILENHGVHVNTTEAQQIGEHAGVNDILKGDNSYAHSGSSMDRIGETGTFKVRKGITAKLLSAAKHLKLK